MSASVNHKQIVKTRVNANQRRVLHDINDAREMLNLLEEKVRWGNWFSVGSVVGESLNMLLINVVAYTATLSVAEDIEEAEAEKQEKSSG